MACTMNLLIRENTSSDGQLLNSTYSFPFIQMRWMEYLNHWKASLNIAFVIFRILKFVSYFFTTLYLFIFHTSDGSSSSASPSGPVLSVEGGEILVLVCLTCCCWRWFWVTVLAFDWLDCCCGCWPQIMLFFVEIIWGWLEKEEKST